MPVARFQMPDGRIGRFEVPDGTTPEQAQAMIAEQFVRSKPGPATVPQMFTPSGEREQPSMTSPEGIAGNPATRFALGAASPFLGAQQVAANAPMLPGPLGLLSIAGKAGTPDMERVEQMKRAGMEQQGAGTDVMGMAGTVLSPASLATMKIPPAASALGRIGQGGAIGAGFGATTPVTNEGDFWGQKAAQTGTGAALGLAIPGVVETGRGVISGARNQLDLLSKGGAGRILTRYQNDIIGQKTPGRQQVINALQTAREPVPGYQPTAAEVVANIPAGSPLVAHQKITAQTAGGPSAAFGQRVLDQKDALTRAVEARASATDPMRQSALTAANAGGVNAGAVIGKIDTTLGQPGIRASDVVNKTLNAVKEKIESLTDEATGVIDANDLYTIRKEIGNTVQSFSKETANWDKRLTGGLERTVQNAIDDAIEQAGGTGWRDYLREFSDRSKAIEGAKTAVKTVARPPQKTNLGGGVNVAEQTRLHLPQMLSRPMMLTNAVLTKLGRGIEPALDAEATRRYLNPNDLGRILSEGAQPRRYQAILDALQRGAIIGSNAMTEEGRR